MMLPLAWASGLAANCRAGLKRVYHEWWVIRWRSSGWDSGLSLPWPGFNPWSQNKILQAVWRSQKNDWWVIIRAASPFSQRLGVGVQNLIIPPEDWTQTIAREGKWQPVGPSCRIWNVARFHCRGLGFDLWSEIRILHATRQGQKKQKWSTKNNEMAGLPWVGSPLVRGHTCKSSSRATCCSVTKSRPTLCNPMDCSTPGFPVLYHLPELAQTHVHWVDDVIQPSHTLMPASAPAFNPSQHLGLFQWVSSSHQMAKVSSFSFSISPSNEYLELISFRIDLFDLLAVQGTLKSLLQHHSSKASILQRSAFFMVQLSHLYMTTGTTIVLTR